MKQSTHSGSGGKGGSESNGSGDSGNNSKGAVEATIGISVKIIGDISGKEDLIINGTVEGTIDFRENNVVIGTKGYVSANVVAKNICVEGEVKGELRGGEQITIMPSGRVMGDIRAPRVILSDGCQFKGSVDMEDKQATPLDSRDAVAKLVGVKPLRVADR